MSPWYSVPMVGNIARRLDIMRYVGRCIEHVELREKFFIAMVYRVAVRTCSFFFLFDFDFE